MKGEEKIILCMRNLEMGRGVMVKGWRWGEEEATWGLQAGGVQLEGLRGRGSLEESNEEREILHSFDAQRHIHLVSLLVFHQVYIQWHLMN